MLHTLSGSRRTRSNLRLLCLLYVSTRDPMFFWGSNALYAKTKIWDWGPYKTLLSRGQSFLCTPSLTSFLPSYSSSILPSKMSVQDDEAVHEAAISTRPLILAISNTRVRV